jgi:hypothetical protein
MGSGGADLHDALFEFFVGDHGFVLDPGLVSIDGVDGIFEDAGDLFVLVDPHADQGEDAEVGVEEFVVLLFDLIFFAEEVVETLDEIGEEFEEDLVEIPEELFLFLFWVGAVDQGDDIIPFAVGDLLFDGSFELSDLVE